MTRTIMQSDVIQPDIENFIKAVLDGIAAADKLSCDYKLEITRNDVAIIANHYKAVSNIEIS